MEIWIIEAAFTILCLCEQVRVTGERRTCWWQAVHCCTKMKNTVANTVFTHAHCEFIVLST